MTALGVVVGTAAVVVLISLGAGLQRQALQSLGSGAQDIRITSGVDMDGNTSAPQGAASTILDAGLLARIEALPGVDWVVVFEPVMAPLDVEAGRLCARSVRVVGVEPEDFARLGFAAGAGALDLRRGQAVLGARVPESLARALLQRDAVPGAQDLVGERLTLYLTRRGDAGASSERAVRVEAAGVLAPRGSAYDFNIYISHREALELNTWFFAQRRDPGRQGYPEVLVRMRDVRQTAGVERQLAALGLNVLLRARAGGEPGRVFH